MYLVFHGGKCCGLKTIHTLGTDPKDNVSPVETHAKRDHDKNGDEVKSDLTFYHEGAPVETGVARLDRYIEFMKRVRPQNIIEICLAVSSFWSQDKWFPILKERGFKEVTKGKNSNTGNMIHIFHLVIDKGGEGQSDDQCSECGEIMEECDCE